MGNRFGKKLYIIIYRTRLLLLTGICLVVASCSQNKKNTSHQKTANAFTPPQVSLLSNLSPNKQPKVIFLKDVPKPVTTNVSSAYISNLKEQSFSQKQFVNPLLYTADSSIGKTAKNAQGKGFFTTYTTDNGLALDQIYCSYQDRRGNLWFGTNGGGVCEYDGKTFNNYTIAHGLSSNVVWCITEDRSGNLWFGTDGSGASRYDGERFTSYTTTQGLPDNVIFSIKEDKKGQLWFGTLKGGVSRYDGKRFTNYSTAQGLAHNAVKCIMEDDKSNLWFGTFGGGVSKYDGKNFINFDSADGLANNIVWSIAQDKIGNIWFGLDGSKVSKYDGDHFTDYKVGHQTDNVVQSIFKDKQNNLWFGTSKEGISKYDGKSFINYTTAQGLANNSVRSICQDEKDNLWFGTYGGGVSKYSGSSFTNFTKAQGLSDDVIFGIVQDLAGNIWLATSGGGISKYDGKNFLNYTTSQGLSNNNVYCITKDKTGELWVGTSGSGVSRFDGKHFINYTRAQGLANNVIFCITADKNNNIWFGTSGGGVSKYDGKSFTNYTTDQGLASNVVFSITEDSTGNLWFGTLGGGVSKYDGSGFTTYTTAQGLANNVIWCIMQDRKNNLWFGTQQGLSFLPNNFAVQGAVSNKNDSSGDSSYFKNFYTKDGLPDNFITQVVQGNDEKLYIGTNLGIAQLSIADDNNVLQNKWTVNRLFNSQTGYPIKDVNAGTGAMYKDDSGIIWIGTGSDKTGLVRFEPKSLADNNLLPPKVFIKNIKINNESICWSDLFNQQENELVDSNTTPMIVTDEVNTFGRQLSDPERDSIRGKFAKVSFESLSKWHQLPQKLVLPHYYNNIGFDFNAVETGRNFLVKYQYMLDGYDKEWSPVDTKTSVNFGNIYEGTYTFLVKAQSPEGVWSKPMAYTFEVLPPWWRTWWMYVIYAVLAAAFIVFIMWWNNRQILNQKNILEQKVKVATKQIRLENEKVKAQKQKIEETLQELEATQAQLIHSEKMASLGQLTAGIAHEIQNPLNFVNNFSELNNELLEELKAELQSGNKDMASNIISDIQDNQQKINQHGKRADAIVKGMLQHSQKSSNQKESININALANECLRLSYQGFRVKDNTFEATLITDFDPAITNINIIPQDIVRVLINLYNNAFYTVNERKHTINAGTNLPGESYKPEVSVSTKQLDDKIEIRITDNGGGIPATIVSKIFQPFFTTKPTGQGTGLGLSLSYDIIKTHGGEIDVQTTEGQGSTFVVDLPLT